MAELTHKEFSSKGGHASFKKRGKEELRENSIKGVKARLDLGQISQAAYDAAVKRINEKFDALPDTQTDA